MLDQTKKIKIVTILPNLNMGGMERGFFNICKALDQNKYEITLLLHEKAGNFVIQPDPDLNIKIDYINNQLYKRTDLPKLLLETIKRCQNADIILAYNEGRAAFSGIIAAKILGKPVIASLHFDWLEFRKISNKWQMFYLHLYRYADRITSVSQGAANSFRQIVPVNPSLIKVNYNGILIDKIQKLALEPLPEIETAIFAKPTVISVGRLDYQKGYDYLIEAHVILLRQGIDHNLLLVGQGGKLPELQQQAIALGVSNSVHFVGFQNNPYKYMKNATIFALSSRFEGFGNVLLEAMLCGLPIVSTNCPSGPSEILADGRYGLLVEPNSPSALAEGIKQVLTNSEKRQELSKLSLERSQDFRQDKMVKNWENLFDELAQSL